MKEEESLSEIESMRLINEMISKAKSSYITTGAASLVWGALIVFCSLLTWLQIHLNYFFVVDVWLLTIVAVIFQVYFSVKESKQRNFVAHDETINTYVWSAFGICIFLLSFYSSKFGNNGQSISSLFMLLYGIPTFITGGVYKFKPMIAGGIICWALSIISMFTDTEIDMLLMAASGLFAWLIPGIILWRKYQKKRAANV
jgi:hypothetical protein